MAAAALHRLEKTSPHLRRHPLVEKAKAELAAGDDAAAELALETLTIQLQSDQSRIQAAFLKFDHDGSGSLDPKELKSMFEYLGFPSADSDVAELIGKLDKSKTGKLQMSEFQCFVEELGGCDELFAVRRARVMARTSTSDIDV